MTEATDHTGAAYRPSPSRYPHISLGYTGAGAEALDTVPAAPPWPASSSR
ncbi:hypothetical protein AB0467_28570 [Streptomyces sp. NPDC052095]